MPRVCTICTHPHRDTIDRDLLEHRTLREITGKFPDTTKSALDRHRNDHITPLIAKAVEAENITRGGDLLAQVQHLAERAQAILAAAEADGDRRHALGAIREARGCLELLGKVAGQIGADVHVQIDATLIGRAVVLDPEASGVTAI
jgi:hypothetical protein